MALLQAIALTPRNAAPALPGTWKLAAGRAITLEPRDAGVLKVAHGQVWATLDGPHPGAANDSGDVVLGVGEHLRLRRGQRLVIEAWNQGAPAYFSWEPSPVLQRSHAPTFSLVVQPLQDLRMALAVGSGAIARLAAGLARVGWQLLAGHAVRGFDEKACGRERVVS